MTEGNEKQGSGNESRSSGAELFEGPGREREELLERVAELERQVEDLARWSLDRDAARRRQFERDNARILELLRRGDAQRARIEKLEREQTAPGRRWADPERELREQRPHDVDHGGPPAYRTALEEVAAARERKRGAQRAADVEGLRKIAGALDAVALVSNGNETSPDGNFLRSVAGRIERSSPAEARSGGAEVAAGRPVIVPAAYADAVEGVAVDVGAKLYAHGAKSEEVAPLLERLRALAGWRPLLDERGEPWRRTFSSEPEPEDEQRTAELEAEKREPGEELDAARNEGALGAFRTVARVLGEPWIDQHGVLDHVRSRRRRNSDLEGHVAAHARALRELAGVVRKSESSGVPGDEWRPALERAEELLDLRSRRADLAPAKPAPAWCIRETEAQADAAGRCYLDAGAGPWWSLTTAHALRFESHADAKAVARILGHGEVVPAPDLEPAPVHVNPASSCPACEPLPRVETGAREGVLFTPEDENVCEARGIGRYRGRVCTEPAGHPGWHAARGEADGIVASWPGAEGAPEDPLPPWRVEPAAPAEPAP